MSLPLDLELNPFTATAELGEEAVAAIAAAVVELLGERATESWPGWLSIARAAAYIDVTPDALRKLVDRGGIAFTQDGPGCRIWIARRDLDAWMLERRVDG